MRLFLNPQHTALVRASLEYCRDRMTARINESAPNVRPSPPDLYALRYTRAEVDQVLQLLEPKVTGK